MNRFIKAVTLFVSIVVISGTFFYLGYRAALYDFPLLSPLSLAPTPTPKPLLAFTIPALAEREFITSELKIQALLKSDERFKTYTFSFVTLAKKMTGTINIPVNIPDTENAKAIVMLRGYVAPESYQPGLGTRNAAAVLAENGFITVAPDFFSYGGSEPEPTDSWQARFEKPIIVAELIKTLEAQPLEVTAVNDGESSEKTTLYFIKALGLWGHSNGGQIALTTLEVLNRPIPTTLWAPVTAPFPYSILFFSDEVVDEGKAMRQWLSIFERDYDVFEFTLTKHLHRLRGPLQLHHGTADEAALIVWSDEFADKIEVENKRRLELEPMAETIELTYFRYPGADHNLQPSWQTVVERDLQFFNQNLQ